MGCLQYCAVIFVNYDYMYITIKAVCPPILLQSLMTQPGTEVVNSKGERQGRDPSFHLLLSKPNTKNTGTESK